MFAEHQNVKIYASNIADIVTVASTTIANVTIVAYYLDRLTVKNNVFKPTQKQSIGIIEVCFINGHYDLIVNTTAQAELEYDSTIFNNSKRNSSKISTLQCLKLHSLQFFSSAQRLKLSAEVQEDQQSPLMPYSYSSPVKQQL